MVKLIAVLFLLAGAIKVAGPWTKYVQDQRSLFALPLEESDSKCHESDAKEKLEQEQAFFEYSSIASHDCGSRTRYFLHTYRFVSSHRDEPPCPPPDTSCS